MRRASLAAVLLLFSAPAMLPAQSAQEVCEAVSDVSVGYWVEYEITGAGMEGPMQGQTASIRQAIVNAETVDGTEHWWMETKMDTPMGAMIAQMLIPAAWPFNSSDVKQMVMKMGDQPAMRMPEQMMTMMRNQMPENPSLNAVEECGEGEVVGWEEVTVPAGTFRALHIKPTPEEGVVVDAWVSPDVPFGMVKIVMSGSETGEIVLTGHGTDATSSINEPIRDMPGMGR